MAIKFKRSDLLLPDYIWNDYHEDDKRVSGTLDDTKFTRSEGNEVLYLINVLLETWGLDGKNTGSKIERMIRNYLPYNITKQLDVKNWLKDNWNIY